MKFSEVFNDFINTKKSFLKDSTIVLYQRIYNLHFNWLSDRDIEDLTSKDIDDWIKYLRINNKNNTRISYDHELTLLKNIINFYNEFLEGKVDIIKKKHSMLCNIKPRKKRSDKDFRESEFKRFIQKLALFYGRKYELLAMIQYYSALRISEAVALHYKDFHLDYSNPYMSYIQVHRSVVFSHDKGHKHYLQEGFKNGDLKILPIFPELFVYIKNYIEEFKDRFLFIEDDHILDYNAIKRAYNRAFKLSGLLYKGTHILRHGGCSRVFNLSGGNIIIASQLLGNSEQETIKTYAHSYTNTLQVLNNNLYEHLK